MATYADRYFQRMSSLMERVCQEQQTVVEKVAQLFAKTIQGKGTIWAFGCTHASMMAWE